MRADDNKTEKAQFGSINIGGNVGGNVDIKQAGGDIVGGDQDRRTIMAGRDYMDRIDGRAQVTTGASGQAAEITTIDQLHTKEALQEHYALLSEKITELRKALILENDAATRFKLKYQIDVAEALLTQIEQRLEGAGDP
jgi:formylmethanofuran dehydrogenase subunit C